MLKRYLAIFFVGVLFGAASLFVYLKINYLDDNQPEKVYKVPSVTNSKTPDKSRAVGNVDNGTGVEPDKIQKTSEPKTKLEGEKTQKQTAQGTKVITGKENTDKSEVDNSTDTELANAPPVKLTREQIIQDMLNDGMTMEQIQAGTFLDVEVVGGPSLDAAESAAGLRLQSTKFGTQEHFEALQSMIRVYENSILPPYRMMAEHMKPRDANGNPITEWEVYRQYLDQTK